MEIELPVTLEDLYVGNEKSATVKRRVVCRNCKNKMHTPRCRRSAPRPSTHTRRPHGAHAARRRPPRSGER